MLEANAHSRIERTIHGMSVPVFTKEGFSLVTKPMVNSGVPEHGFRGEVSPDELFLSQIVAHDLTPASFYNLKSRKDIQVVYPPDIPGVLVECPLSMEISQEYGIHPGGMSKYLAEYRKGPDIIMLSTLASGLRTAGMHFHSSDLPHDLRVELPENEDSISHSQPVPGNEIYKIVYGSAKIHHEVNDEGYVVPNNFWVAPGVDHWMEAGENGAIFALIMKNAAIYPPDLRHIR